MKAKAKCTQSKRSLNEQYLSFWTKKMNHLENSHDSVGLFEFMQQDNHQKISTFHRIHSGGREGPPGIPIKTQSPINQTNNKKNTNSINYKNFTTFKFLTIMKKQILILAFIVLATFANVSRSYAQCTPTPLTPAPGIEYDYGVTIVGTNTSPTFLWYATTDVNLLTGTKLTTADAYFTVGAASAYNNTTGGTANLKLTWTPKAIGTTFYLVVKYTESSASGCTVENMRVYEVKPINTFLLAINGTDATGAAATGVTCAAPVTGAVVTAATPTVAYTYGQNVLYYKVTASGILGDWRPSIQLPALAGLGQNYANAEWNDKADGSGAWHSFGLTAGDLDGGDFVSTDLANVTNVAGTSILVRIRVENVNFETLANQTITVGVDGHLPTAFTESDIIGGAGATACNPETPFGKKGSSVIEARPTVNAVPATGAFIPKLP